MERHLQGNSRVPDAPDFEFIVGQVRAYHPAVNYLDILPQSEDEMALAFTPQEVGRW